MNYGHPLRFGTFLTPLNQAPERVVALAKRSEALGYDLVTFQDHPYQAAFLDTWTLLTWVAAQTERIELAPNVLNLPLRQPAVLARSAASLDLLSKGRFNLALGAGAFWDAIEAMGVPRLTPAESVDAFSEGLEVIRGILDVSERSGLRLPGKYYPIKGAKRGPMPAHPIPIWVGALKPRMLRLIGQKGDGWLVTLGYVKVEGLRTGNQQIDEAAAEAGRDPREIRRLLNISGEFAASRQGFLNGTSKDWVEDLLPLATDEGIGTFILASDDERTLAQFAQEVAPALREAVDRALPMPLTDSTVRSTAVKLKRHPGLDYDAVPESLADAVIEPGDMGYARVRSTYARGGSPGIVFQVKDTAQVIAALAFARDYPDLPLSIRSGGHGFSGRSTNKGGIVIDLSRLNRIEVLDEPTRHVRIEPGARWGDVAAALAPYGWALSSGDYGGVGVGGLATAGGIGWLVREHGLTIDHLRAVELILADGTQVRASDTENTDLFWAVRGAGANFGIATAFEFEVDAVGQVGWAQLVFDANDTAGFLEAWGAAVEAAPRDLTSFLLIGPRPGQPMVAVVMAVIDSDQPETIINRLQPIAEIAPLLDQEVVITSYAGIMANAPDNTHDGMGEPYARSGLIEHLTPEFADAARRMLQSGDVYFFQIRAVGGAVADVPSEATAYAHRTANFSVAALGANRDRLNRQWDDLAEHFDGLYLSFETDQRPERLYDAFPPATLERLRVLKQRYDPANIFRDNFNVAPEAAAEAR